MRIVFMGTPEFSVPTLEALIDAGHDIVAAYAQPPRKAGRGMAERKSPVHAYAEAHGIEVRTPLSLRGAAEQAAFAALGPDVAVVVAYGLLLPEPILAAPRFGCLNMHASLLPRWRGAAPINRAIMAGDPETAAVAMRMERGLDTGPMCLIERVAIPPDMTAGELHDVLKKTGARVIVEALARLAAGALTETPQPEEGVTYAAKIEKAEAKLDFDRPARAVHDHIRGLSPFPGAWFEVEADGRRERVKVLRSQVVDGVPDADDARATEPGTILDDALAVKCAPGAVRFLEVQRSGKKPCAAADFLRGFPLPAGTRLL